MNVTNAIEFEPKKQKIFSRRKTLGNIMGALDDSSQSMYSAGNADKTGWPGQRSPSSSESIGDSELEEQMQQQLNKQMKLNEEKKIHH